MDSNEFDNIVRRAKALVFNPQVATYAGIGITTSILAYYTLFDSTGSIIQSSPSANEEEEKEEEPPAEEEEEEQAEE